MLYTTFSAIIPSFLIILIGYTLGKVFSEETMGLASKVAIWVMVPTVTFTFINEYTPSFSTLGEFGLGVAIIFVIFYLYSRLFKEKKEVIHVTAVTANVGYLGYPILLSLWGEEALSLGVVYATLNIIMFSAVLPMFLGEKVNIKNLFRLPYVYALIAGFLTGKLGWSFRELPEWLVNAILMLKQSAIPYLLLYVGLSVSKLKLGRHLSKIGGIIVVNKLFLAPLIALVFALIYGLEGLTAKVFVLETAMPAAVNAVVLTSALDGDSETVGYGVTLTTFFAIFTLPVWAVILERIFS
ncbi:Auxin Efflux Carrier [Thermotoga petrophila RKU-1]|jgi:hypothetical protein|uniref:Auxin Efflux Carrier n=1 Tax=Thermotoga petrophila (strain ATCC BAA-488 / DSM 13995 / JCM 10881 / RKU-1) TaxID=390874 RepID=A5IJZ6_THEP1|nr:AEC family transporter [Thermotoga petrophila]ABQ46519.1 Auxin Efflux Carrier [Thermotoga petrophila RKU-1]